MKHIPIGSQVFAPFFHPCSSVGVIGKLVLIHDGMAIIERDDGATFKCKLAHVSRHMTDDERAEADAIFDQTMDAVLNEAQSPEVAP